MVAVKILDKEQIQHQNMGQQIKKEISIMKQLKHPNVVQMKEVLASRSKIFIVIEYISGGELFEEIVKKGYSIYLTIDSLKLLILQWSLQPPYLFA